MIYGYARVSTDGQSVEAHVRALRAAGAGQVFREVASGAVTDRARLRRALDAGDVLMVTRLDRLARSTANHLAALELAAMLERLYVSHDRDAAERLHERGSASRIDVRDLVPVRSDFNEDLCELGLDALGARPADQEGPAANAFLMSDNDGLNSTGSYCTNAIFRPSMTKRPDVRLRMGSGLPP